MKKIPNKKKQENYLALKASARERTQFCQERASKMQHTTRSITPDFNKTTNTNEKMDIAERAFEERAFPKEDNGFFSGKAMKKQ